MSGTYREALRRRASTSDAAFVAYLDDLELPELLRSLGRFADRHQECVMLAPRGFGKTTALRYRTARLIGCARGADPGGHPECGRRGRREPVGIIRRLVEHPRFAEVFPWATSGVAGSPWRDDAWTVRGVDLARDVTCRALSLGSVRAGARLDVLVADDPVGRQESATSSGRSRASETFLEVILPMLVPDGQVIVAGTRWHERDLYAELVTSGWPSITRQAIEDGRSIWPERFTLEWLADRRDLLGTPLFNLQYMNDPSGLGGNVFRREWFRHVDVVPDGIARRVGVDLNASSSERSDYTAVVEYVEGTDGTLCLVGVWRDRLADGHRAWLTGRTDPFVPTIEPAFGPPVGPRLSWPLGMLPEGFAGATGDPGRARRLSALNIESGAFQTVFAREVLRQTALPVREVRPDRDKVTRARPLAARYEAARVVHLRSAPGLADFEDELVTFPNGEHDDQVDAAVYAADLGAQRVAQIPLGGPLLHSFSRSRRRRYGSGCGSGRSRHGAAW